MGNRFNPENYSYGGPGGNDQNPKRKKQHKLFEQTAAGRRDVKYIEIGYQYPVANRNRLSRKKSK